MTRHCVPALKASDSVRVKICGLRSAVQVAAAVDAGAAYLGFVFFARSPRAVTPQIAARAVAAAPAGVARVALLVDADDATISAILDAAPMDMLQLHGQETAARIAEIRARFGLPVMKAVGVATHADLAALERYGAVADQLLVDAKPPPGAERPGGNALAFDWNLIAGRRWPVPWMLAGGLSVANVARAVTLTGARQVDVSSGVERAPGDKDPALMAAFVAAARGARESGSA